MKGVIPPLVRMPAWRVQQQRHLHTPNLWYGLDGTVRETGGVVFVFGTRYFACFAIFLLNRLLATGTPLLLLLILQ
jgi:hypothetical protein